MAEGHEVARAVVTIIPSLAGAQKTITKELTGASEPAAQEAGSKSGAEFVSKFGSALKKVSAVTATAFAAVSAVVIKTTKDAVSSFAEYEQLVGGVDTLFKDSSAQVQKYAENAFQTAGMSANEYMSTVTSFSASLLKSLGGDTDKAAHIADMAMTDMSDNANKMGTDMASIQTAYQGFAKQNYTMLDNLKLGYGGTKSEMERLLADATRISKVKYDIRNLSDVYSAIHVIQTEMDITGTTAKEAMTTISGSAGAAKAAWQNVLTTIAGGGPGLQTAVDGLMTTVFGGPSGGGLLNNLLPVVKTTLEGIGSFIAKSAPMILPRVTDLVTSLLPGLITATTSILTAITDQFPTLIKAVTKIIPEVIKSLSELIPQLASSGLQMLKTIIKGISDNLPSLFKAASSIISTLISDLSKELPDILAMGGEIILQLGAGIIKNAPQLLTSAVTGVQNFISGITGKLPEILKTGGNVVTTMLSGISEKMPGVIKAFTDAMSNIVRAIGNAFPSISDGIARIVSATTPIVTVVASNFTKLADTVARAIVDIVKSIAPYTPAITSMVSIVASNIPKILHEFTRLADSIGSTITKIVKVLAPYTPAITQMLTTVTQNLPLIIDSFSGLLSNVKPIINSIADLITKIGDTVVAIVDSIGSNLGLIVDDFSAFNVSLATPIKAIGDAISGMVNAISGGIVAINDSISRILDKLAGVFDSIGNAAVKAGEGFKTVTDAAVNLANNTSVLDLAASLGAVASGIKNINIEADWSANHKIGQSLANVGAGLKTLTDYSVGIDGVSAAISTLSESVKTINEQINGGGTARTVRDFGIAIGDMVKNAGTDFVTLGASVIDVLGKINRLASEGANAMWSLAAAIRVALAGDTDQFNLQFGAMEAKVTSAMTNIMQKAQTGMQAMTTAVTNGMNGSATKTRYGMDDMVYYTNRGINDITYKATDGFNTFKTRATWAGNDSAWAIKQSLGQISWSLNNTSFNLGSYVTVPHFSLSGSFNLEKGTVPSIGVKWYDKGGVFSSPAVIGVGEKRPEFVGALDDLREIVREESNTANVTINVYGSEGQNIRDLANIVMDRITQNINRQEAAFA